MPIFILLKTLDARLLFALARFFCWHLCHLELGICANRLITLNTFAAAIYTIYSKNMLISDVRTILRIAAIFHLQIA